MTSPVPLRWHDRLANFERAVALLEDAIALGRRRPLSELEKSGVVQQFEIAWELGWKLMADYLIAEMIPPASITPVQTIRGAGAAALIDDPDAWMRAGKLRNMLSHTYDGAMRDRALVQMEAEAAPLFRAFADAMASRRAA